MITDAVYGAAERRALEVLEDPAPQLADGEPAREHDPVVQRAIATAHADGFGTYRQLAAQFGLTDTDAARTAIERGALFLSAPPAPAGAPRDRTPADSPSRSNEATEPQRKKFDQFNQLTDRDQIVDFLRRYITFVGLDPAAMGATWGITVCPSRNTVARVNVGPRESLAIAGEGLSRFLITGSPPPEVAAAGMAAQDAFKDVPGSMSVRFDLPSQAILDIPTLAPLARAFVDSQLRRINPVYHNPLVGPLLGGE
jgi:hypothetical protein